MAADTLLSRIALRIVPALAAGLMRFLWHSSRREILGADRVQPIWARGENVVIAFWHEHLGMMAPAYIGPQATVLISASRDGELIARTMTYFRIDAVRGSSRRGGRAAFRELLQLARRPVDLVITPDGPKGPRREAKDGIAELVRMTGRPFVPMCFVCSRGHRFASWDRFLLPSPFCRIVVSYGEPVIPGADEPAEALRDRIVAAMNANEERAAARLKSYGLSPL